MIVRMDDWFSAGSLTDEEMDQLVRLAARYAAYDVDQFEHWWMPSPVGSLTVDFGGGDAWQGSVQRVIWPPADPEDSDGWSVWEDHPGEPSRLVVRHTHENTARMLVETLVRVHVDRTYRIEPPPSGVGDA